MAKIARYVRDKANDYRRHSDGSHSFSAFAVSEQIREPVKQAADQVIGIARGIGPKKSGNYISSFGIGTKRTFWFKPKDGPLQLAANAAAIEWGSGVPNTGATPDIERPQGGNNQPFRVLGRAGARVGDFHE
jgi:hypothetical protein